MSNAALMVADMGACGKISPSLPAGRYDSFCRGVMQYALTELGYEERTLCSKAKK